MKRRNYLVENLKGASFGRIVLVVAYIGLGVAATHAMFNEENYPKAIAFLLVLILIEISEMNPRNHR